LIFSFTLYAQDKGSGNNGFEKMTTLGFLNDSTTDTNERYTLKDSFRSGLYSFILPGLALGQLYNEDYLNWGIRLGISAACFGVTYALIDTKKAPGVIAVSLLIYSINWVSSIFEASATAKKINLRNKYKYRKTKK